MSDSALRPRTLCGFCAVALSPGFICLIVECHEALNVRRLSVRLSDGELDIHNGSKQILITAVIQES